MSEELVALAARARTRGSKFLFLLLFFFYIMNMIYDMINGGEGIERHREECNIYNRGGSV